MDKIQEWLEKFRSGWKSGDLDKVLGLFTEDVDYYETPSEKLEYNELREEWKSVINQEEVSLNFEVFSRSENRYTVKWSLSYVKEESLTQLRGVYLIVLNSDGYCQEFWQYCQSE